MIDIKELQSDLIEFGFPIGIADGVAGKKTFAGLLAFVSHRRTVDLLELGEACANYLPRFGLMDTPERLANWLGQTCHESGGYHYLREIWGPTDAQRRYEGRHDLGNTEPGDGKRFMGRGLIQITGRNNYKEMAMRSGKPILDHPELAETPDCAVLTACIFWQSRCLHRLVDEGKEDEITRRINGGVTGIDERRKMVARAKSVLA